MLNDHSIIISLIKTDIKCQRLLKGLRNAGALDDMFRLDMEQEILTLMGLPIDEEIMYRAYEKLIRSAIKESYSKHQEYLDEMAHDVFLEMMTVKNLWQEFQQSKDRT